MLTDHAVVEGPRKAAARGVKVRIWRDAREAARLSEFDVGAPSLSASPPTPASGSPLAFVRDSDRIRLSVEERRLEMMVDATEPEKWKAATTSLPPPPPLRGYAKLYSEQALQADEGCDFALLEAA